MILVQLLDLYSYVVFGSVMVSWIGLPQDHQIVSILRKLTEPLLSPIRQILPSAGGLDFSPLVLIVGLRLIRSLVLSVALGGI